MALAARLPVLEGAETVLKAHPEWRSPVYALVRQWASSVPCGHEVHVIIGGYQAAIEPERYARMFPDSFFDPALDVAPPDIAGRSLGERGADPCTPVIYTLLPLDAEEAWACLGWRATSRRRLGDTCRAAIHGQSQVNPQTAGRLAVSLRSQWQDMPATCR